MGGSNEQPSKRPRFLFLPFKLCTRSTASLSMCEFSKRKAQRWFVFMENTPGALTFSIISIISSDVGCLISSDAGCLHSASGGTSEENFEKNGARHPPNPSLPTTDILGPGKGSSVDLPPVFAAVVLVHVTVNSCCCCCCFCSCVDFS